MTTMEIKEGSTLWCETLDERGDRIWRSGIVTGEKPRSWVVVVAEDGASSNVSKATMLESLGAMGARRWYVETDMNVAIWLRAHRQNIANHVGVSTDVESLKQVAVLIGYDASTKVFARD